ncbi:MAG: hypothetical protein ACJ8AK_16695 [Gemmatimonadaceae bacterium]
MVSHGKLRVGFTRGLGAVAHATLTVSVDRAMLILYHRGVVFLSGSIEQYVHRGDVNIRERKRIDIS